MPSRPTTSNRRSLHGHRRSHVSHRSTESQLSVLINNIGHTSSANDTLRIIRDETQASIVLIQEPVVNAKNNRIIGWGAKPNTTPAVLKKASRAVTVCASAEIGNIHIRTSTPDTVAANVITWHGLHVLIINLYLRPRQPIEQELSAISQILHKRSEENVIVAGDWNSRSSMWGDQVTNSRSEEIVLFAAEHRLNLIDNSSPQATFVHHREGESHIDFAIGRWSDELMIKATTLDELTHDHRPILLSIEKITPSGLPGLTRFNMKKADWGKFHTRLRQQDWSSSIDEADVDLKWDLVKSGLMQAIEDSIPRKQANQRSTRFWNETLAQLRQIRNRSRTELSQARRRSSHLVVQFHNAYHKANYEYKCELKRSKLAAFKQFVESETDSDPWSIAYKVCRDKIPALKSLISSDHASSVEQSMDDVLDHFFPHATYEVILRSGGDLNDDESEVSDYEIEKAIQFLSPDKAPGPDMITGEIWRQAFSAVPEVINDMYKRCFSTRSFPKAWKEAVLAVVPKPGKDSYDQLSSFRPISLLSVPGKVLDRILIDRINHHLYKEPGLMNNKQYGFKPQHSTEMAIKDALQFCQAKERSHFTVFIALDIKSAFDTASHDIIIDRLIDKKVPGKLIDLTKSFLTDRTVHIIHEAITKTRSLSQGCPQGSISGPSLWNVLIDSLPACLLDDDTNVVCFADDTLIQVRSASLEEALIRSEEALHKALTWCDRNRLRLNTAKTEVMIVPKKIRTNARDTLQLSSVRHLSVTHKDEVYTIFPVMKIKYLGVVLDSKLCFYDHIDYICTKASKVVSQLARGAKSNWGFSADIMKFFFDRCIAPIVCYACPIWGHRAIATIANARKIQAVHRLMLIRSTRSYRTVSYDALCAISGSMPLLRTLMSLYHRPSLFERERAERPVKFTDRLHPAIDHRTAYKGHNSEDGPSPVEIYTDGSKIDKRVGCAFSVFENGWETIYATYGLAKECSVFQAEMIALREAIKHASQTNSAAVIISDSKSSLEAISGHDTDHPLVFEVKKLLMDLRGRVDISLRFTRAHVGTPGNERADQLAKRAAEIETSPVYDFKPVSTIKTEQRQRNYQIWQTNWEQSETGRHTYNFLKSVTRPIPGRLINYATTQFFTGHGAFVDYLVRFRVIPAGKCLCGNDQSSPSHVLTECNKFESSLIQQTIKTKGLSGLLTVLHDNKMADKFIDFCKDYITLIKAHNFTDNGL